MTGMFTGCGSSQQAAGSSGAEAGQTQTGDNSLFNEPGQLPIVNEPVTLTVFAPANPDGSWEDNEMVKEVYFKYIKANTKNTFVFRPTGSVEGASTIYFSSSNKKYSIIVSPIAGRIRYE